MKIIYRIAAAAALSFITACGSNVPAETAVPADTSMGSALSVSLDDWRNNLPERIVLNHFGEDSAQASVSDPAEIAAIIDSFYEITVLDETDMVWLDADYFITLYFPDGSSKNITFNDTNLSVSGKNYETEGTEQLFQLMNKAFRNAMGTPEPEPAGDPILIAEDCRIRGASEEPGYYRIESERLQAVFDIPAEWYAVTDELSNLYLCPSVDQWYTPELPYLAVRHYNAEDPKEALDSYLAELKDIYGDRFHTSGDAEESSDNGNTLFRIETEHPYNGEPVTETVHVSTAADGILLIGQCENNEPDIDTDDAVERLFESWTPLAG